MWPEASKALRPKKPKGRKFRIIRTEKENEDIMKNLPTKPLTITAAYALAVTYHRHHHTLARAHTHTCLPARTTSTHAYAHSCARITHTPHDTHSAPTAKGLYRLRACVVAEWRTEGVHGRLVSQTIAALHKGTVEVARGEHAAGTCVHTDLTLCWSTWNGL